MKFSLWDLDGMTVAELKKMLDNYSSDARINVFTEYEYTFVGGAEKDLFEIIEKEA